MNVYKTHIGPIALQKPLMWWADIQKKMVLIYRKVMNCSILDPSLLKEPPQPTERSVLTGSQPRIILV